MRSLWLYSYSQTGERQASRAQKKRFRPGPPRAHRGDQARDPGARSRREWNADASHQGLWQASVSLRDGPRCASRAVLRVGSHRQRPPHVDDRDTGEGASAQAGTTRSASIEGPLAPLGAAERARHRRNFRTGKDINSEKTAARCAERGARRVMARSPQGFMHDPGSQGPGRRPDSLRHCPDAVGPVEGRWLDSPRESGRQGEAELVDAMGLGPMASSRTRQPPRRGRGRPAACGPGPRPSGSACHTPPGCPSSGRRGTRSGRASRLR